MYYRQGLGNSTHHSYKVAATLYNSFCRSISHTPIPTSEYILLLFTAYLGQRNLAYSTIKAYLSAVRNLHVAAGMHRTFSSQLTPRVQQVLRGIQKTLAVGKPAKVCLPITINIMVKIKAILSYEPHKYHNIMMWAACCIVFFGFLRFSEFTAPSQEDYDPYTHLSYDYVAVDNRTSPTLLTLQLKQSKTDPFHTGVTLTLGKSDKEVCPVTALMPYLAIRGSAKGPLFITENHSYLTQPMFRSALKELLQQAVLHPDKYNTHSFRVGAATTVKSVGISDYYIKVLGRWQSDAYQCYIRTSPKDLANFTKMLATNS